MRILLADDHAMMRDGLRKLLEGQRGCVIVGEAEDGVETVRLAIELRPDIIIMDIGMPSLNGIEATRQIRLQAPDTRVLALSMYADRQFAQDMFKAGASGYVLKGAGFDELMDAIVAVSNGHRYISRPLQEILLDDYLNNLDKLSSANRSALSDREREVLQLLAEGKSNKEIAGILRVTVNTVDAHRKHISDKLSLKSIAELTKYAVTHGISSLEIL